MDLYIRHYGEEPVPDSTSVENLAQELQTKGEISEADNRHQTRGGKGLLRDETKLMEKEQLKRAKAILTIKTEDRNRRKSVTHIKGFELFGLDLKKVSKRLANKYACGCSVVKSPANEDELVLQGDYAYELPEFIAEEWPEEISAKQIKIVEKK